MSAYAKEHPHSGLQPYVVAEVCRRLARQGWLTEISTGGIQGLDNRYYGVIRSELSQFLRPAVTRTLSCAVYGFSAVYEHYASSVLPVVHCDSRGNQQIGTCFVIGASWSLTAWHCVQSAASFAIRSVDAAAWKNARVYVHPNAALDLAIISFASPVLADLAPIPLPNEDAVILEEVMALGYPSIPGFGPALAAEAATVSGRLAAATGRIASAPTEIFAGEELYLITARVRGGFSGGPILDSFGQAVGIVSREPTAEGNGAEGHRYDALGYGTAIPTRYALELSAGVDSGKTESTDLSKIRFTDFM